ncbi:MAG: ABC transporter permease [Cyclobacteriaceae bacterium]|nr:ABC transporter permease [Cyclobacteriaceae bacterium]
MKSNLRLAWRNLWRNKRRTLITVASIFFGVLLATLMSSMQEGSYSSMINNIVKFYSGYIQVQHEDYWDTKTINNTFVPTDSLIDEITSVTEVTLITPRLESFALASSEEITRGCMVIGIDPEKEKEVMDIGKWVSDGVYLEQNDRGVLVGFDLAKYLELSVGDTLVLIGQGYHGTTAAGVFPIRGILKFPSPELNKQSIYLELKTAQEFYSVDQQVTFMVLMLEDQYDLKKAMRKLSNQIASPYAVMTWEDMHPELLQMVEADRAGALIMKAILYIIIAFGVLGTIMMLVMERKREMGVMVAIGMQRSKLSWILFFETIYIGLIGVIAGFTGSIPLIAYFYHNPIPLTGDAARTMEEMGIEPLMYFSWLPSVFYNQVITVFIITALIALYPVITSYRLKVQLALKA